MRKPYYKVWLSMAMKEGFEWWLGFARTFNGKAEMLGRFAPVISTYSDALN